VVSYRGQLFEDPYRIADGRTISPTRAGAGRGAVLEPRPDGPFEAALLAAGEDPAMHRIRLADGLDLTTAPVPALHATVSLRGLGIQLTGRFFPTVELGDDLGDMSAFGGGVLVNVSRFMDLPRVDIGVTVVTQKVSAGDYLSASGSAFGLLASTDLGPVTLFTHGTIASGTVEVSWTARNPDGVAGLPLDGSRQSFEDSVEGDAGLTLGASLHVGRLGVSAEFRTGRVKVISAVLTVGGP
jgi:hypothetical protein